MKTQGKLLILVVTFYPTFLFPVVDGNKGKLIGEACSAYDDCGESPQSFIACQGNICQCHHFQYYEEKRSMCVSFVGKECDAKPQEPQDTLPVIKCGEDAVCTPKLHEKFGRCQCKPGFSQTYSGKCTAGLSKVNQFPFFGKQNPKHDKNQVNSHHQMLQGASNSQPEHGNEAFPFPSGSTSYTSGLQSQLILTYAITVLLICSTFILT